MKQYVSYLRVSTQKQGRSGLGLEAQRKMCAEFITHNNGTMVQEFMDVESGTHRDRKGLWQAIDYCKANNLPLVIAKLDRLARDVEFTFRVINTGIDIHFCDMPQVNTMILGVFAAVAQYERELTSDRTKKALAQKKLQGCKLGASNEKWRASYNAKTKKEKSEIAKKGGLVKNKRFMESKETVVFLKCIKKVFPEYCENESPTKWIWQSINTRERYRNQMRTIMKDYHEMMNCFPKWDFTDDIGGEHDKKFQQQLARRMFCIKRALNIN